MSCETIQALIDERPLGLLDEPQQAALAVHTAGCGPCAETERALSGFFADWAAATRESIQAEPLPPELRGAVLRATDPADRPQVSVSERPRVAAATCVYCHDQETPAEVECRFCRAPHHADCFAIHGACAAPGCSCTAYAQRGRSPFRWRVRLTRQLSAALATAAVLCVASVGGGMVWWDARERRIKAMHNAFWAESGDRALSRGYLKEALTFYRADILNAEPADERRLRALIQVIRQLQANEAERHLLDCDWERTEAVLKDPALRAVEDPQLRSWLEGQRLTATRMATHADRLRSARERLEGAMSLRLADDADAIAILKGVLDDLAYVQDRLGDPGRSHAADEVESLRVRASDQLAYRVSRLLEWRSQGRHPDWTELLESLDEAERAVGRDDPDLGRLRQSFRTEADAENRYAKAVEIVKARDVARYPEAQRLLQGIDRGSRLWADADAYLGWIEADRIVREARVAYDAGDLTRALGLLGASAAFDVLGPKAHTSVKQKRAEWTLVAETFITAEGLQTVGKTGEARAMYLRVVELEPNPGNYYHQQARKALAVDGE